MKSQLRVDSLSEEDGAILPIVALMIVILLVFAAFTVDLGAAWGQRTLNQSAADAGVMGGGIGFVGDSPQTNEEIVAEVEKYVDINLGYQISGDGVLGGGSWATCVDPKVTAGEFSPSTDVDGIVINPCVSLSADATPNGERIFRASSSLHNRLKPRSLALSESTRSRRAHSPKRLSSTRRPEPGRCRSSCLRTRKASLCLGDMPPGLAQDPCDGSNTAKRSDIISPWKGTDDYPGTPECTNGLYTNELQANIALGLDHTVRPAGGPDSDAAWPTTAGQDDCDAEQTQGEEPYALKLGQGGESLLEGFAGDPQFGAVLLPGRLRQGGGRNLGVPQDSNGHVSSTPLDGNDVARLVEGAASNPTNMWLDNVGLWEYFASTASDTCTGTGFAAYENGGATATEALRPAYKPWVMMRKACSLKTSSPRLDSLSCRDSG